MGTAGGKAAPGSDPWRDDPLVELDQQDEGKAKYAEYCFHQCSLRVY